MEIDEFATYVQREVVADLRRIRRDLDTHALCTDGITGRIAEGIGPFTAFARHQVRTIFEHGV